MLRRDSGHVEEERFGALFLVASLVVIAAGVFANRWACDDAFITFRYSRNLSAGLGLRYNVGANPPVEGFSNLLWVLLCSLPEAIGARPWRLAWLVSAVSTLLVSLRLFVFSRRRIGLGPGQSSLVVLVFGLCPSVLVWGTGGLETMAFCLSIFVLAEQLVLNEKRHELISQLAALALLLLRPEGFAWILGIYGLALVSQPRKVSPRFLVPSFLTFALLVSGRLIYYGSPLPNTYYAKVGWTIDELWRGLDYIALNSLTLLVPCVSACAWILAILKPGPSRLLLLQLGSLAIAPFLYSVAVGGDYMSYGRLLVPSYPFQALILGVLIKQFSTQSLQRRIMLSLLLLATVITGLLPMADIYVVPKAIREAFHVRHKAPAFIDENDHLRFMKSNSTRWRETGMWLAEVTPEGSSVVVGAIGNIGYYSNLEVFDPLGLVTRLPDDVPRTLRSPGHDRRVDSAYFAKKKPTVLAISRQDSATPIFFPKKTLPFPYAPVVHVRERSDSTMESLVVYQRMESMDAYQRRWQAAEQAGPP